MTRFGFWRSSLAAYVAEINAKPFVYGEHDCGLFAAGAVLAMTGEDFAADYRGKYSTLPEALKLLKANGFKNHADLAAHHFPEIHPSQAAMGDLVAVKVSDRGFWSLGVANGAHALVLRPDMLARVDLLDAQRAFRIG